MRKISIQIELSGVEGDLGGSGSGLAILLLGGPEGCPRDCIVRGRFGSSRFPTTSVSMAILLWKAGSGSPGDGRWSISSCESPKAKIHGELRALDIWLSRGRGPFPWSEKIQLHSQENLSLRNCLLRQLQDMRDDNLDHPDQGSYLMGEPKEGFSKDDKEFRI
ncbi:hypothetical protein BHE74_00027242 [Ensete ventricosum]|nr:hypothetical protein BHE74_00027242 [Ensete ventricosum]